MRPCAHMHSRATRPPSRKRAERCEATVSIIYRDRPCPVCPTPRSEVAPNSLARHTARALCVGRFLYVFMSVTQDTAARGVYYSRCRWYLGNKLFAKTPLRGDVFRHRLSLSHSLSCKVLLVLVLLVLLRSCSSSSFLLRSSSSSSFLLRSSSSSFFFRDDTASETFLFGKLSAMPSWRHHKKRNTKPAVPTLHIQRQPLHLLSFLVSPSSFRIV